MWNKLGVSLFPDYWSIITWEEIKRFPGGEFHFPEGFFNVLKSGNKIGIEYLAVIREEKK